MSGVFGHFDIMGHIQACAFACPNGWEVLLVADGKLIATSSGSDVTALAESVWSAETEESGVVQIAGVPTLMFAVHDHLKNRLAVLAAFRADLDSETRIEFAREQLQVLVTNLERETTLILELQNMADELNRRHEELNLIYETNDVAQDEGDDDATLKTIVENVVDYLDADWAVLSVPSRNIWEMASADVEAFEMLRDSVMEAEPLIIKWLMKHREPLVINDAEEVSEYEVAQSLPFRTLVVPIHNDVDEVIGGLALCRHLEGQRIVNSDKNLLGALARRISKVIQVNFDPLTGLPRRLRFEKALETAIAGLSGRKQQHCLLHVNIDGLAAINEQMGVRAGDTAIELVAQQLAERGRDADICGRVGGDELALLLHHCSAEVGTRKAEELHVNLAKQPFLVGRARQTLRVSVGVVTVGVNAVATDVMTQASVACAIAKESGGSSTQHYEESYDVVTRKKEEVRLLTQVRQALDEDRFELYAQPIQPLRESKTTTPHFEVLLRLRGHDGEIVSPVEFIPVAEKHSLMPEIDRWVALNALKALQTSGLLEAFPKTVCSVNLSGQSFGDDSVLNELEQMLRTHGVPAENLCLEVTETAAIQDIGRAQYYIGKIRKLGCQFALDDFGAGLSSFTYLRLLPLDYVKIDGSFVKDIQDDPVARVMVESIHNVGATMGLKTVAEYVENDEISACLRFIGVDFAQGFGIGKPEPIGRYLARYVKRERQAHG